MACIFVTSLTSRLRDLRRSEGIIAKKYICVVALSRGTSARWGF